MWNSSNQPRLFGIKACGLWWWWLWNNLLYILLIFKMWLIQYKLKSSIDRSWTIVRNGRRNFPSKVVMHKYIINVLWINFRLGNLHYHFVKMLIFHIWLSKPLDVERSKWCLLMCRFNRELTIIIVLLNYFILDIILWDEYASYFGDNIVWQHLLSNLCSRYCSFDKFTYFICFTNSGPLIFWVVSIWGDSSI